LKKGNIIKGKPSRPLFQAVTDLAKVQKGIEVVRKVLHKIFLWDVLQGHYSEPSFQKSNGI